MISITSKLPRKKTVECILIPIEITRTTSREFKQDNNNFDPTISSSPPNNFMETLTKRYMNLQTRIDE